MSSMNPSILHLHLCCQTNLKWRWSLLPITLTNHSLKYPTRLLPFSSFSSPKFHFKSNHQYEIPSTDSAKHTTVRMETFHENQRLKSILSKLREKDSTPLQVLKDGDWNSDQFWTVMRFLKETSRSEEILQVFELWKNIEKSRINEFNYKKIIKLLVEEGLMKESVLALQDMKANGLYPSLKSYNSIIHGFTEKGEFEIALLFLKEMEEMNLKPQTETYNGFIQAYGNYGMYDEMGKFVKKMESKGIFPNYITYNLLVEGFARGRLLKRMEKGYQTMLSKRMKLMPSTLIAMLEAYVEIGILEKMEKVYRRILNSKIPLQESLIRKLGGVYINNHMFSRLEDLGLGMSLRMGNTDLVWCLQLLSQACILSRKGINSIVREMEIDKFLWNASVLNIMALAYLKMNDFREFEITLSKIGRQSVKPDMVTFGVLFDANMCGYDGTGCLEVWRKMGFLEEAVEMNTDPLVLAAFGKGRFLQNCEEMYSSLGPEAGERSVWTYQDLIDLVFENERNSELFRVKQV